MYKKILISFLIIVTIFFCVVFILINKNKPNEEEKLKEKVDQEIEYMSSNIISIANELNNIQIEEFKILKKEDESENNTSNNENSNEKSDNSTNNSGNNSNSSSNNNSSSQGLSSLKKDEGTENKETPSDDIDWDNLVNKESDLYQTWSEIIIDLYKLNNNNDDILNFSKCMDEEVKYLKDKDKKNSLFMLAKMYQFLPKFIDNYGGNEKKIELMNTKYNIIVAYSLIEDENWDEIKKASQNALNEFNTILKDVRNNKNQYNVNKTYILLNEFINSIDTNDKEILYIKYKNLIQEIEFIGA